MFKLFRTRCTRSRRRLARAFSVEALEARQMLAGDVMVTFNFGVLQIVGDAQSNRTELVSDGTDISIQGFNGTTINGPTSVPAASVRYITIEMGDGNDHVALTAENTSRIGFDLITLTIETGDGNDLVRLDKTANAAIIVPTFVLDGGAGRDTLFNEWSTDMGANFERVKT